MSITREDAVASLAHLHAAAYLADMLAGWGVPVDIRKQCKTIRKAVVDGGVDAVPRSDVANAIRHIAQTQLELAGLWAGLGEWETHV